MAIATAAKVAPAATTPKNFHDGIRNMFSGVGANQATSTNSLAYTLENGMKSQLSFANDNTKQQTVMIHLMTEQNKLLKRIASGGGIGGALTGIIGNLFGMGAGSTIAGLGKKMLQKIFGPMFERVGAKLGITAAVDYVRNLKSSIVKGLEGTVKSAGNFVVRAVGKAASGAFDLVAGAGRMLMAPLNGLKNIIFSSGAFKAVTETAGRFAGGAAKLLGKLFWPVTALLGIVDGISGWMNSDSLLGKADGASTIMDKVSSAVGSVVNGLLLGIPNWLLDKFGGTNLQKVFAGGKDWIANNAGWMGKKILGFAVDVFLWPFALFPKVTKSLFGEADISKVVFGALGTVKDALWSGLQYLGTAIAESFTGVFKGIWDAVKDWWNNPNAKPPSFRGSATGGKMPSVTQTWNAPTVGGRGGTNAAAIPTYGAPGASGADIGSGAANDNGPPQVAAGRGGTNAAPVAGYSNGTGVGTPSTTPSGNAGGAPGATLGGTGANDNAKALFAMMTAPRGKDGLGYTKEQAMGFIANMQGESGPGLDPTIDKDDRGSNSAGIAQWRGDRREKLIAYAKSQGKDYKDFNVQKQFLHDELYSGSEQGADRAVRASGSAQEALTAAVTKFERPQFPQQEVQKRLGHLAKLNGIDAPTPTPSAAVADVAGTGKDVSGVPLNAARDAIDNAPGFNDRSKALLKQIDPDLAATIIKSKQYLPEGTDFQLGPSTIRTIEEQAEFVRTGRSKTMNSQHLTGRAGDLDVYRNGKYVGANGKDPAYTAVTEAMRKASSDLGVDTQWGGDSFGSFKDQPHWQLNKKYNNGQMSGPSKLAQVLGLGTDTNAPTATTVDQSQQMSASRASIQLPIATTSLRQQIASPMFDQAISDKALPLQAPPPPPVDTSNTGPIAAQSNGKNTGDKKAGAFNVSDIPVTDEYKMMIGNGSALT